MKDLLHKLSYYVGLGIAWVVYLILNLSPQVIILGLFVGLLCEAQCNPPPQRVQPCQEAVHNQDRSVGFRCCVETCGDAGVAGYAVTTTQHVCECK